jgi:hypothetical protein
MIVTPSASLSADTPPTRESRRQVRVSLVVAWVPMWILCAGLLAAVHDLSAWTAAIVALRLVLPAAFMGFAVQALAARWPWPVRMTPRFVLRHVAGSTAYGVALAILVLAQEAIMRGRVWLVPGWRVLGVVVLGLWLYVMIASFSYTVEEARRAARAEAAAVRTQLEALRGQLQPHFLFNALHTVVHLIPVDPATAARAAEELAGLLRAAMSESRDLIPLREERAFVTRYLALEQLRFEDRLRIEWQWSDDVDEVLVPSFAVQTLVENAMRHGAAQRVGATHLTLSAVRTPPGVRVVVADAGTGASRPFVRGAGTGLDRLGERLQLLYGGSAACTVGPIAADAVESRLEVPALEDTP